MIMPYYIKMEKIMKSSKKIIYFACVFFYSFITNTQPIETTVNAYFFPQNRTPFIEKLNTLLQNAQREVLFAMHWLTDEPSLTKIIRLKKDGINVQLILDGSMVKKFHIVDRYLSQLIEYGIVPYILPSQSNNIGTMHNKFIVIDTHTVITGSANFTQSGLANPNLNSKKHNYENILILDSPLLAIQFKNNFLHIKNTITRIYEEYVDTLANEERENINAWIPMVLIGFYKHDQNFEHFCKEKFDEYDDIAQNRLRSYFPDIEKPSRKQLAEIEGVYTPDNDMTFRQLEGLMNQIIIEKFIHATEEKTDQNSPLKASPRIRNVITQHPYSNDNQQQKKRK